MIQVWPTSKQTDHRFRRVTAAQCCPYGTIFYIISANLPFITMHNAGMWKSQI